MPTSHRTRPLVRASFVFVFSAAVWAAPAVPCEAARIDSVAPSSAEAGDQVTITGRGLAGPGLRVSVGGQPAAVVAIRRNRVTFVVPDGLPSGPAEVRVTRRHGRPATATLVIVAPFDPTLVTGSVQQEVVLDETACLAGEVVLETATAVKATLTAGTCVHDPLGAPVTGPVTVGIDDAGGPPAGSGLAGVVRLFVRTSSLELVPAVLSPPAQIQLPLAEPAPAGTWYTHVFEQGGYLATGLPAASGPFIAEAIVPVPGAPDSVSLDAATVLGIGFEPAPVTAARRLRGGLSAHRALAPVQHTVTLPLPPDPAMPDPRVFVWRAVNQRTAHIVAVGQSFQGIGAGDVEVVSRAGHPFSAALVQAAGQHRFEMTSDYANRFAFGLIVAESDVGPFSDVIDVATGGCADEACTDQLYVGAVIVDAWAVDFAGLVSMRDTLAAQLPAGARLIWHTMHTLPTGAVTARWTIREVETSTQLLRPGLPADWETIASDRMLSVDSLPLGVTIKQGTAVGYIIEDADENRICCPPIVLAADRPPPVFLGPPGRTLGVHQPSLNVLAVDATGSAFDDPLTGVSSLGGFTMRARLSFRRRGTLQIDIETPWLQGGDGRLEVSWTLDSGETAICQRNPPHLNCLPAASSAFAVGQGETRILEVTILVGGGGADQSGASGRAVNITFTPAP